MTVIATYQRHTPKSRKHFEEAAAVIPAGATRSLNAWPPYPVYLESGAGTTVVDLDGNSYRDFLANYTALPLGYADPDVTEALAAQLASGTAHSFSRAAEKDLAEVIVSRIPSAERVRFTGSGTEAVMFALRLAKAFTGRTAIAKAEGGYHGTTDEVMISVRPAADLAGDPQAPASVPEMAGISPSRVDETIVVPFNDIAASTAVKRTPLCDATPTGTRFLMPLSSSIFCRPVSLPRRLNLLTNAVTTGSLPFGASSGT